MSAGLEAAGAGLAAAFTGARLGWCCFGALTGLVVGLLPGIGPLAAIALLLPGVPALDAASALVLLAAVHYGAQVGSSTSAALAGGEAGRLASPGAHAAGAFVSGTLATVVLAIGLPALAGVGALTGAAKSFALMALALVASLALGSGSLSRSAGMLLLGLMLGEVDHDVTSGSAGLPVPAPGISRGTAFVGLAVGLFAIGGVLARAVQGPGQRPDPPAPGEPASDAGLGGDEVPGQAPVVDRREDSGAGARPANPLQAWWRAVRPPARSELARIAPAVLRGTLAGVAIGMLPGRGPRLAARVTGWLVLRLDRGARPAGHDAADALLAAESAHQAASQASLLPLLALGIPVNAVTALMAGALALRGLSPGPPFAAAAPELPWLVIGSMALGQILLLLFNAPLLVVWRRLWNIPQWVFMPVVVVAAGAGLYAMAANPMDVFAGAFFGLAGVLLMKLGCDPAPLLLAFVLGPAMQARLREALAQGQGDWSVFVTRPLSAVALFACLAILCVIWLPSVRARRDALFR